MEVADGQAAIEWILDGEPVTPFVVAASDVQRLVDVSHQVDQPGQGVGFFHGRGLRSAQEVDQTFQLPVQLAGAATADAIGLQVDVMPVSVPGNVDEPICRLGLRIASAVRETLVLTDVVGPGGGLDEGGQRRSGTTPDQPAAVVRMLAQQCRDLDASARCQLFPGHRRHQAMACAVPGQDRLGKQQQGEGNEGGAHGAIMPRAIMAAMTAPPLPDSLAATFLHGARVVAAVLSGRSLADGFLTRVPVSVRPAVQDLVYGTLRAYGSGDFFLARLLQRPLEIVDVRALLLLALHRLENRPEQAHTTVDQAVAAAGQLAAGRFRGLVNGVLRNALRQWDSLVAARDADDVGTHRHPGWWLTQLRQAYGEDWRSIVAAGNGPPPMALRVNRRRTTRTAYRQQLLAMGVSAHSWGDDGLALERPLPVDRLPGFDQGWVSVQDPGAQRAAELLDPAPGSRVLDACAAPGGKTGHLLERGDVDLLALDLKASRCRRVEENLARLGLTAAVQVADCALPETWWDGRPFAAVLADVPCTASGVVRRHPDAKWLRREADIASFARTQWTILNSLWQVVDEGGTLLYATCSVFPAENSQQMTRFLAHQPGAGKLAEEQLLPTSEHDGFYYCLLEKRR